MNFQGSEQVWWKDWVFGTGSPGFLPGAHVSTTWLCVNPMTLGASHSSFVKQELLPAHQAEGGPVNGTIVH